MLNQPHAGGDAEKASLNEFADELTEVRFESQSFTCRLRTISSVIAEHHIESIDLLKVDVEKSRPTCSKVSTSTTGPRSSRWS